MHTPLLPRVAWLALTGGSCVHTDTRGWDIFVGLHVCAASRDVRPLPSDNPDCLCCWCLFATGASARLSMISAH